MLPILYKDQNIVVINKPAGLLVHKTKIDKYETQFAIQLLRDQLNQYIYPVHRLDKPTSGALVFALNKESAHFLANEFVEKRVQKKYLAVVRGYTPESALIDHPLKEKRDMATDSRVSKDKPAQTAITQVRCLSQIELPIAVDKYETSRYSLVEALPITGRKHQIRRHLKHINCPIIGDSNYGSRVHNQFFKEKLGVSRLLLTCTEISFTNPLDNQTVTIKAPLCDQFSSILKQFHWNSYVT